MGRSRATTADGPALCSYRGSALSRPDTQVRFHSPIRVGDSTAGSGLPYLPSNARGFVRYRDPIPDAEPAQVDRSAGSAEPRE